MKLRATPAQLLAVACPTCGAKAGAYCEREPGRVLLLPAHHEARFRAALGLPFSKALS